MNNIPPTSSTGTPKPASGNGQVVPVQSLPDGLKNVARAIRVEGEVVQQNSDGSTRIKTSEGNIDITIRGKQPQPGTRLEIDIPAGNPPRQVIVRPAPTQTQQPQQPSTPPPQTTIPQPNIPPSQTPAANPAPETGGTPTPAPTTPSSGTPVPPPPSTPQIQPHPVAQPDPSVTKPQTPLPPVQTAAPATTVAMPSLPPLAAGETVTLVPMLQENSSSKNPSLVPPSADNIPPGKSTQAAQQATLIAGKAQEGLFTTLMQAVKSALPNAVSTMITNSMGTTHNAGLVANSSTVATMPPAVPSSSAAQLLPVTLSAKIASIILPSGQAMYVRPLAEKPLSAPTSSTAPSVFPQQTPAIGVCSTTPNSLTITVTEVTMKNQPVLSIPINNSGGVQNFILQSPPASVPIGTQITLIPQLNVQSAIPNISGNIPPTVSTPNPTGMPNAASLPTAWRNLLPLMQPSSIWPVIDDVFQSFYQATPQAAQILGRIIPSPANGSSFGPAVLLFAAAIRSGDFMGWIGDKKMDMLHKLGKESLLSRLAGETSSLAANADTPATEWKSLPIPLLWQNEISKVMLHVREEPPEQNQESKDGAARFVLDLSLTRMGDVQLDGLVRGKQIDLIVRTQAPVSGSMQDAMRVAYANALDGTDVFGEIGFQSDIKAWRVIKNESALAVST